VFSRSFKCSQPWVERFKRDLQRPPRSLGIGRTWSEPT